MVEVNRMTATVDKLRAALGAHTAEVRGTQCHTFPTLLSPRTWHESIPIPSLSSIQL